MNRKINKKKIITLLIIVLIIILTLIFSILYNKVSSIRVFFDNYIFRKSINENDLPQISIDNSNVFSFNNNMVLFEKNVLSFFNKSAEKLFSLDVEVSNPLFKSSGNYLCVADKNGTKIYVISGKNILWQKNIEGKITDVTINKNGYVAVSISDTSYKTVCKVFNESGTELFTSFLAKSYIIESAISNDNKFLALAEANFSGITIQSNVKIISIDDALANNSDSIVYNYTAPIGDFIINIKYCDNSLVCVYDNHIDIIKDYSNYEIINFEEANILFADINNKLIQVEKFDTGILSQKFELQIINIPSLEKKVYELNKEPKSIYVSGNVIAINFGSQVLFINNSGWLIKDYTASQEIQSIVLSNNLAGIVYKDKIEFLSL